MKLEEKIELIEAARKVADFWEVEPAELVALVVRDNKEKVAEWNEIVDEVKSFHKASFEERAKMLGVKLYKNRGGEIK